MESSDIRENIRSSLVESRLINRDKILANKRKALQDVVNIGRSVNNAEVTILANKLKCKSVIEAEDLALLKISFVQSNSNIVSFLKVKGALHGLVGQLTSQRSNYQLLAAECCCNLALGDAKSCLIVAKAAAPYLITMLSGSNYNLIATSVWALGNLVGSDEKTWKIVLSQGFLGKLLHLISEHDKPSDITSQMELQKNSLTALTQLLQVGLKLLTVEEIQSIARVLSNLKNSSCKNLRVSEYCVSSTEAAERELIENKAHLSCLQFLKEVELSGDTVTEYTACLRTLANLVAESTGSCALQVLQQWLSVQDLVQKVLTSPYKHLWSELGWFLGNLVNHPSVSVQVELQKFCTDLELFESKLASLNI